MRITKIERRHSGGIRLQNISRNAEEKIGSIQQYAFFKNTDQAGEVYYIVDDTEIIAAAVGNDITVNNITYFQILGVLVDDQYRGQNIGSDMYNNIMHDRQQNLMSDIKQTDDGQRLWYTINKTHIVKVLDLNTGDIVSDDIDDAYPFAQNNSVLVTANNIKESILIPTYTKREK